MTPCRTFVVASLVLLCCCLATGPVRGQPVVTALEDYVYTADSAYNYKLHDTLTGGGFTAYLLIMDSLRWRNAAAVDTPLWTHQIAIVVPDIVTTDSVLLIINGGSNALEPPDPTLLLAAAALATTSGSVLAVVSQIPNQPLLFSDQPSSLREDGLVAYSWDKAMDTGDATWAAYLPMTKASVRAMDAIENFINTTLTGLHVEDFVVTGFSKRGATAWLVAAVDPRVRAVAPGVFDVLNFPLQIERHYQAYGFYSSAIDDYEAFDIIRRVRSPEGRFLASIVDPMSYSDLLHLPKLLLNSTGDQFFLPDAANFYVGKLPGETLIRQVPNTDHGFTNGLLAALDSLLAWYQTTLSATTRPRLQWQFDDEGALTVSSEPPAQSASLWQATNSDARDFRLETIGAAWEETVLSASAPGRYEVDVPSPPAGAYTGYLVALTFAGGPPAQTYGTPVFVTPETLPFELEDPIAEPKTVLYWRCQLPTMRGTCPAPPDYTPAQLQALLPLPVFGQYVNSLDDLASVLTLSAGSAAYARSACMATRLNIATAKLGWYTRLQLPQDTKPLWQLYAGAEDEFAAARPQRAARICGKLNQL